MPKMNPAERYERLAELYYRETGRTAPGKDISPVFGITKVNEEERLEEWKKWLASGEPLDAALRKIARLETELAGNP